MHKVHIVHNVHHVHNQLMPNFTRALAIATLLFTSANAQPSFHLPPLDRSLPPRAEAIYKQLASSVDDKVAMDVVNFMAPIRRTENKYMLSDHFMGGIAVHLLRSPIPAPNIALQILAVDRVLRGFNNGG